MPTVLFAEEVKYEPDAQTSVWYSEIDSAFPLITKIGGNEWEQWRAMLRFPIEKIPYEAEISVVLLVMKCSPSNEETLATLKQTISPWDETTTWYNMPQAPSSEFKNFTITKDGFATIPITWLVKKWTEGRYSNYGLLMYGTKGPERDCAYLGKKPYISVSYTIPDPCEGIVCDGDLVCKEGECTEKCDCEEGACCIDCEIAEKGKICSDGPIDVQYLCFQGPCGGTLKKNFKYLHCNGFDPECLEESAKWSKKWQVEQKCAFAQECFGELTNIGYCYESTLCCKPTCKFKQCGSDGCMGICGTCDIRKEKCYSYACITPLPLCGACSDSGQCADHFSCMGYKGYPKAGQVCVPEGCVTDDDCPQDFFCHSFWDGTSVCWVKQVSTTCINGIPWDVNACGVPFKSFSCFNEDVCFEGACCTPKCKRNGCGDNGCGGDCGACSPGQGCVSGACTECIPGIVQTQNCLTFPKKRQRICGPEGYWLEWGACENDLACPIFKDCIPGQIIEEDCGLCGRAIYVCSDECAWKGGVCRGEGECRPLDRERCTSWCGTNGTKVCNSSCRWGACSKDHRCECMPGKVGKCGSGGVKQCNINGIWAECELVLSVSSNKKIPPDEASSCTCRVNGNKKSSQDFIWALLFVFAWCIVRPWSFSN